MWPHAVALVNVVIYTAVGFRNHQVPGPGLNTTEPPEPTYNLRRRELKTIMKVVCGASADIVGWLSDEPLRPRRAIAPGKLNLISRTYLIDGMPVISHISGAANGLLDAKRS